MMCKYADKTPKCKSEARFLIKFSAITAEGTKVKRVDPVCVTHLNRICDILVLMELPHEVASVLNRD